MGSRTDQRHLLVSGRASRRRIIGITTGIAASVGLGGRSLARQEATPAGGWSFTDDKGVTIELDTMPERLVMDVNAAAPLWDFGIRPVAVFGWNATETGDFGAAGGNIDPSTVDVVGNTTEPVQLEAMIGADPDLIITLTWTPDVENEYWSIEEELVPQVRDIAPLLAMSATGSADVNTERFAELAAALGANLDSPVLTDAKAAYETALSDFEAAAAETSDLTVLFGFVDSESYYVAAPGAWGDLTLYQNLGMSIVTPDVAEDEFWEQLSLEQALKYPADIFMASTRPASLGVEELKAHPTFGQHPAIQAGQVAGWNQDFIQSYQGMTEALNHVTTTLREARKVI